MSTILHLSDLHLGDADAWERKTDDKVGLVPRDENARLSVLSTSLKAVQRHLAAQDASLDVVVVSGDITSKYETVGFERFGALLDQLKLVPAENVVVVPGNHDVDWRRDPGTPAKYAQFLEHTRAKRMRTPICDGVDFTGDPKDSEADPVVLLDDCVVVAINSANWCGVKLGGARRKDNVYDIARVSEEQLDRLTDMLRAYDTTELVRIAVLHHHLLPVSENEEVKYFESFTNLARLRAWLRDHGFHAVLHGHKHQSALTWDHVYEFAHHDKPPRRMLVVSAPTPTSWGDPVCRLIQIGDASGRRAVPFAPRADIQTVIAERHERAIAPERVTVALDPGTPDPPGLVAIDAPTADAAYERLVHELGNQPGKLFNVTCVVRDAQSAEKPPTNFAVELPETGRWFADAVAWWQVAAPELVAHGEAPFNHGERLHATGTGPGALDRAAQQLGSTKATVLLVRQEELRVGTDAPAFVAVQLVRATDSQGDRLDCVGYFRKQDLTLWWPVNVGELRRIQKYVLDLLTTKRLRAGRLVTFATEAIHDEILPRLAGTLVDRNVDLRPEVLMAMAYGAAHASPENRDEVLQLWTDVLRDIGGPREARTGDFPSLGIDTLLEHLKVFQKVGDNEHLTSLIKRLESVSDRAQRAKRVSRTKSDREEYSEQLFDLVGEVLNALAAVLPAPKSSG